jgi:hypothetical protein
MPLESVKKAGSSEVPKPKTGTPSVSSASAVA